MDCPKNARRPSVWMSTRPGESSIQSEPNAESIMTRVAVLFSILLALVSPRGARADCILPGTKPVAQSFVVVDSAPLEDFDLWLVRTDRSCRAARIVPGVAFSTRPLCPAKLCAIRKGEPLPDSVMGCPDLESVLFPGRHSPAIRGPRRVAGAYLAAAELPMLASAVVPAGNPIESLRKTLRVDWITPGGIELVVIDEARLDASGRRLNESGQSSWLAGLSALGLCGLLGLASNRARGSRGAPR